MLSIIADDINDADKKLGTTSIPTATRIIGNWNRVLVGTALGSPIAAGATYAANKVWKLGPKAVTTAAVVGGVVGGMIGSVFNVSAEGNAEQQVIDVVERGYGGHNISEYVLDITNVYNG